MKPFRLVFLFTAILLACSTVVERIQAAPLTWNAGTATWDTTTANWSGSTWTDGSDAVFGGTAGTVTISPTAPFPTNGAGNPTANSLTFNTGAFQIGNTVGDGTIYLGAEGLNSNYAVPNGTSTANKTTTIDSNITLTAASTINTDVGLAATPSAGAGAILTDNGAINNNGFLLTVNNRDDFDNFNGVISGSGGLTFTGGGATNSGITVFGLNTFTGAVLISGNQSVTINTIANAGMAQSLGAGTGTASIISIGTGGVDGSIFMNLAADSSTNRTIDLLGGGTAPTTITSIGTGNVDLMGSWEFSTSLAHILTFGGTSGSLSDFNKVDGVLANGNSTHLTSVIKTGSGFWELNGANTYSGGTTLAGTSSSAAGTLLVGNTTGSGTGFGAVAITGFSASSTATLGGTGIIAPTGANAVTMGAFSVLAPGTSTIGKLTIDGSGSTATNVLNFSDATATLKFKLDAGLTNDQVAVTGGLSFSGNTVNFTDLTAGSTLTAGLYALITDGSTNPYTGLMTSGTAVDGNAIITGGLFIGSGLSSYSNYELELGSNDTIYLDLDAAAVPEPSTWILLLAGLSFGIFVRRHQGARIS